jgi:hypothetical protein
MDGLQSQLSSQSKLSLALRGDRIQRPDYLYEFTVPDAR